MIDVKVEMGTVRIRKIEGRLTQILAEATCIVKAVCNVVGGECSAEVGEELLNAAVLAMAQERVDYHKLKEAEDSEVLS